MGAELWRLLDPFLLRDGGNPTDCGDAIGHLEAAEVLNLGGSDVLEKPFSVEHVERVIGLYFTPPTAPATIYAGRP